MYIINKILMKLFIVLAVVFTTACDDNKKDKVEILKIYEIWSDSVPDGILADVNTTKQCNKGKDGKSYLLMPSSVPMNQDINIKLYGCWNSQKSIKSSCTTFNSFESSVMKNKISLVAKQNILNSKDCKILPQLHFVSFKEEYNITNNFEIGEVEIVVKNPDGEELTHVISVE